MGLQARVILLGAILALLLSSPAVNARTWRITPDGSGDAPTIQAGIDSAEAGDDVVLAAGTYSWSSQGASGSSMVRMKPGITLKSEVGPDVTILDAEFSTRQARGRVILCHNVSDVRIEGLTIQNGFAQDFTDPPGLLVLGRGGGIYAFGNSRPTISNCIIRNNLTDMNGPGGGIASEGEAFIEDCQVYDNIAGEDGGGGGIVLSSGRITRCEVRNNRAPGDGAAAAGGIATGGIVEDCLVEGNRASGPFGATGGGVALSRGGSLIRCMVVGNRSSALLGAPGGGVVVGNGRSAITDCIFIANVSAGGLGGAISVSSDGEAIITGCTLIANRAEGPSGPVGGIEMFGGGSVSNTIIAWSEGAACSGNGTYTCTNLYGNTGGDTICGIDGGGNFSADPQFCAADPAGSRNVAIQSDSPCAPENHPGGGTCGLIGFGTIGCGTVDVEERSWSGVKSLYR